MKEYFMQAAIKEAQKADEKGEVPIGAVIVKDHQIIGRGHNQKETTYDSTAHAEILAIREAAKYLKAWRLTGCTLYVTLEPCAMCAGAIVNARLDHVVVGTEDPKTGACGSVFDIVSDTRLNHQVSVEFGVLRASCAKMLKDFFGSLRK
jgi:tRNA(adenine34) deaminase